LVISEPGRGDRGGARYFFLLLIAGVRRICAYFMGLLGNHGPIFLFLAGGRAVLAGMR
jgi:hypothetical protein